MEKNKNKTKPKVTKKALTKNITVKLTKPAKPVKEAKAPKSPTSPKKTSVSHAPSFTR